MIVGRLFCRSAKSETRPAGGDPGGLFRPARRGRVRRRFGTRSCERAFSYLSLHLSRQGRPGSKVLRSRLVTARQKLAIPGHLPLLAFPKPAFHAALL